DWGFRTSTFTTSRSTRPLPRYSSSTGSARCLASTWLSWLGAFTGTRAAFRRPYAPQWKRSPPLGGRNWDRWPKRIRSPRLTDLVERQVRPSPGFRHRDYARRHQDHARPATGPLSALPCLRPLQTGQRPARHFRPTGHPPHASEGRLRETAPSEHRPLPAQPRRRKGAKSAHPREGPHRPDIRSFARHRKLLSQHQLPEGPRAVCVSGLSGRSRPNSYSHLHL